MVSLACWRVCWVEDGVGVGVDGGFLLSGWELAYTRCFERVNLADILVNSGFCFSLPIFLNRLISFFKEGCISILEGCR